MVGKGAEVRRGPHSDGTTVSLSFEWQLLAWFGQHTYFLASSWEGGSLKKGGTKALAQEREEGKAAVARLKKQPGACTMCLTSPGRLWCPRHQDVNSSFFISFVVMSMQSPPLRKRYTDLERWLRDEKKTIQTLCELNETLLVHSADNSRHDQLKTIILGKPQMWPPVFSSEVQVQEFSPCLFYIICSSATTASPWLLCYSSLISNELLGTAEAGGNVIPGCILESL